MLYFSNRMSFLCTRQAVFALYSPFFSGMFPKRRHANFDVSLLHPRRYSREPHYLNRSWPLFDHATSVGFEVRFKSNTDHTLTQHWCRCHFHQFSLATDIDRIRTLASWCNTWPPLLFLTPTVYFIPKDSYPIHILTSPSNLKWLQSLDIWDGSLWPLQGN